MTDSGNGTSGNGNGVGQSGASADSQTKSTSDRDTANRLSPLKKLSGTVSGVAIEMQYGSPGVKERKIWGGLVPYNKVWRAGANEATTISFNQAVEINGNTLPEGRYGFFVIPRPHEPWTLIFNRIWDQWGAFNYEQSEDVLRVPVEVDTTEKPYERLKFTIDGAGIHFFWEERTFTIPVEPAKSS